MDNFLLWAFTAVILFCAIKTVSVRDPVHGALYLAGCMISIAGVFFLMGAFFIAGVQLAVYAGAVMALFVMVLMLFDIKKEESEGRRRRLPPALLVPLFISGALCGALAFPLIAFAPQPERALEFFEAKEMAAPLFTKHLFLFEAMGVLLLVIAAGVVTLTRLEKKIS